MRGSWLVVILMLAARVAHAGPSIIVMAPPEQAGALGAAMQVALAGRGVAIATLREPGGELRLERAASAQRAALQLGADAAVWIDADGGGLDVCAVSADGRAFRHAPLPPDLADATPRAFSAIATSLLDELIAPPEPAFDVDVHVHVDPSAAAPPVALPPPPMPFVSAAPGEVAAATPGAPLRAGRTVLEVGPMISPLSAGLELGLSIPIALRYRLAFAGGAGVMVWDSGHDPVLWGSAEVRHEGLGEHHFDYGFLLGGAAADTSGIGFTGMRLAYTFETRSTGVQLSITPLLASDLKTVVPGAYTSLRLELPL